ncbi:MAG: DUF3105 domain-containing protein [Chloroflexota bacterium]
MKIRMTALLVTLLLIPTLLLGCDLSSATNSEEPTSPSSEDSETSSTSTEESSDAAEDASNTAEATAQPAEENTDTSETSSETQAETNLGQSSLLDIYAMSLQQQETEAFARAVERLGLVDRLQNEGPFTAFIPSTNAFARLPDEVRENDEQLMEVILFHLVEDTITTERLFSESSATSLLGEELTFWSTQTGAVVQNANVLGVTDQVSNGMFYIVDNVMLPVNLAEYGIESIQFEGEESFATLGNLHIDLGVRSPQPYNSLPPTSGPHYPSIVGWTIYEEPIRYEHLVHNLEDGGVVLYYQCEEDCPELVEQLTSLIQPYIDEGRHVVLAPNDPSWTVGDDSTLHQDLGAPIAITAWQKLLKLDEFDAERLAEFIEAYEGIDHHARY